jgi:signal transduction histidine kinase
VGAVQLVGASIAAHNQPAANRLDALGVTLLLIGPAALAVRRQRPLSVLGVCTAVTGAYLLLGYPRGPSFVAAIFALLTAVRLGRRRAVWGMLAIGFAALACAGLLWHRLPVGIVLLVGVWTVVAVALAEAIRVRAQHLTEMARAGAEASRARREQARRQATEERLLIARELHDVLGHHLSLINVRAGVALHLIDTQPEQAREALAAIKQASAEALSEVRGVLSALYPDRHDEPAPRFPTPGLSDVDALVEEARAAGLTLSLRREGEVRPLPSDVDRAAYRIVQEALTNVRRHAGASTATVRLEYGETLLTMLVENTGAAPAAAEDDALGEAEGNGIAGMRERAVALGGSLQAGSREGGGFRIAATLPLRRRAGSTDGGSRPEDSCPGEGT